MTSRASYGMLDTSVGANAGKPPEDVYILYWLASSSSTSGSVPHPSIDFHASHGLAVSTTNPGPAQALPDTSTATPMTSGQSSLMAAIFSLGSAPEVNLPPQHIQHSTNRSVPSVSSWAPHVTDDVRSRENDDPEDGVTVVRPELVLDKTAESNALPFVLQGPAAWIRRLAFEPLKLMRIGRDFVFSSFENGDQSRWMIGLLANVGNRIATVEVMEERHQLMISTLHSAVRRRLETVKSRPKLTKSELVKALDSALEIGNSSYLNDFVGLVQLMHICYR
ncbi:hypothetical protein B0J17DRAFT_42307 [Rhizoctonia solani]|nr:hypothetical protein B0J17DRAFT_42307 [Rhizoctonia solani]